MMAQRIFKVTVLALQGRMEMGVAALGTPRQCVAVTMRWRQTRVVRGLVDALECKYDSAFDGIVHSRAPC